MYVSIQMRLRLLLIVPLILFVLTSVYLLHLNDVNVDRLNKSLYQNSYRTGNLIMTVGRDMYQIYSDYNLLRIANLTGDLRDQLNADLNDRLQKIRDNMTLAADLLQKNGAGDYADADTKTTVTELFDNFRQGFDAWSKEAGSQLQAGGKVDTAKEQALAENFDSNVAVIDQIERLMDRYAQDEMEAAQDRKQTTTVAVYSSLAVAWILILIAGIWLLRHLNGNLNRILNKTKTVAGGNLQYLKPSRYGKDELGRLNESVDAMIEKIRSLVSNISDHTQTVSASAVELSVSAKESAAAAAHVAGNIQEVTGQMEAQAVIADETSRAVEEMAKGVQRIAENTSSIADLSSAASNQVEQGHLRMQQLREQFQDILGSIRALSDTVAKLTEKSEKIGQITENITGFANQTNILSLNASIEAARAGEHGKGFAVVAQEIRKLAAGSIESAETISELIAETRSEIESVSASMTTTLNQSQAGQELMIGVEEDFSSIQQAVKQVAEQVHETSAITEQMSASSEQVSASMDQASGTAREAAGKAQTVAAATEQQTALVENISQAAEQLQDIVRNLKESVGQFKL